MLLRLGPQTFTTFTTFNTFTTFAKFANVNPARESPTAIPLRARRIFTLALSKWGGGSK